jgi:hypothetical protein
MLRKSIDKIKEVASERYGDNLAGLLVLGSVNTGNFVEGESDINTMVFVKDLDNLNPKEEIDFLTNSLRNERFQSQYFHSLESIVEYLKKRKSFSTYLTITAEDGSKILYSTHEFGDIRKRLRENPFTKKELIEHVKEKDEFEIGEKGYMRNSQTGKYKNRAYRLTQNLFFHLRRKIQIMSFLKTGKLIFDLENCIDNTELNDDEKGKIIKLYDLYKERKPVSKEQDYFDLAYKFTDKITG